MPAARPSASLPGVPAHADRSRPACLHTVLYARCADAFRNAEVTVHSFATFTQLSSIDGKTLRAPGNQPDDLADAFALALCGRAAALSYATPPSPDLGVIVLTDGYPFANPTPPVRNRGDRIVALENGGIVTLAAGQGLPGFVDDALRPDPLPDWLARR